MEGDQDSDPDSDYWIYYYDASDTLQHEVLTYDSYITAQVKPNTAVQIESKDSGASSEAWQVGGSSVTGRGAKVEFTMPNSDSSFYLARGRYAGDTIATTIGSLSGGMSEYTYSDFSIVS